MTQLEARRIVWERLATTARADIDNADWTEDEGDGSEETARRLLKACEQVAESIRKRLRKMKQQPTRKTESRHDD